MIDKNLFRRLCGRQCLMNDDEIAEYLGISRSNLNLKLNEKSKLSLKEVNVWCEKLHIDTKDKQRIFLP